MCPDDTFGDAIALTECKSCGGSSNSLEGENTCQCIGLNRKYLREIESCVCIQGYVVPDGSDPNVDSPDDCEEEIYDRCDPP